MARLIPQPLAVSPTFTIFLTSDRNVRLFQFEQVLRVGAVDEALVLAHLHQHLGSCGSDTGPGEEIASSASEGHACEGTEGPQK